MSGGEPGTVPGPAARGVLFDMDGVLVNSLPVMRLALEAAHREVYCADDDAQVADYDALFAEYRQHLGKGFPEIMRAMGLAPGLQPHFKAHSRHLAPYVHAYAGVAAMLQRLCRAGWVLGVATGKDEARATELLERLRLRHHFALVLGYDSVAAPKPAPDMAEAFMAHTGVPCHRLVMVGDAPVDLQCARGAGCLSAAALWGFGSVALLLQERPHFAAASPGDLLEWLLAGAPEGRP